MKKTEIIGLQNLFYIKQRLNSRKCSILYFKEYFLNNSAKSQEFPSNLEQILQMIPEIEGIL